MSYFQFWILIGVLVANGNEKYKDSSTLFFMFAFFSLILEILKR